jgi:hypothetical protein
LSFVAAFRKLATYLSSTECAVALFLIIAAVAIPGTLTAKSSLYKSPFFLILLGLFSLNLILCTIKRYRTLSWPVLILHGGVILTIVGCIMTTFGFVATVNLYEGILVNEVYRWDLNKDSSIDVGLLVKKINLQFHPIPVRIGVLKGEKKEALVELKTGGNFDLAGYRVQVGESEYPSENLKLSVFESGKKIGTFNTLSGDTNLPASFPFSFKLVAVQTPVLKRLWVDLELFKGQDKIAEGTSEVNNPFQWGGLNFYNTKVSADDNGRQYAGIQIVRDPGRPYVFSGFALIALGAVLSFRRRILPKKTNEV